MTDARVFGPVRGAGTQLNEDVGQETLEQGLLGSTLLIGPFERGAEGDITILPGSRSLVRKMGGVIDPGEYDTPAFSDLWCSLTARHFWERSRGAGNMIALRIVPTKNDANQDDRPDKSIINVWNRESAPKLVGTIEAHNGGSWAGKRKIFLGKLSGTPGTDFPASNQIQLNGITTKDFKYDEYRNGYVYLDGLPGYSFKVVNIDPDGLITLEVDQDVAAAWGAGETAGSVTGSVAGPWNLSPADTIIVHCDEDGAGPDTCTFDAARAVAAGSGLSIVDLDGDTLILSIDNGESQTITFTSGATTAALAVAEINAQLIGGSAVLNTGEIDIYSDTYGTDSEVDITGGTALTEIGHSIGVDSGTGDVGDINAVTFDEVKAVIEADVVNPVTGVTVTQATGGYIVITSNTAGASSSIQVEAASTADTALGLDNTLHSGSTGPTDLSVALIRDNVNLRGFVKACDIEFRDGALRADEEFGMIVRIDGKVVLNYRDLSMKQGVYNNWADVINKDPNNDVIRITDTFTGDRDQASARPANHYGLSTGLTATRLTIADPDIYSLYAQNSWVPTLTWAWGTDTKVQQLTVTMTNATDFTVTTSEGNLTWTGSLDSPVDMGEYVGTMTVGSGTGTPTAGDLFYLFLKPLPPNELIGGRVYPNLTDVAYRTQNFQIIGNGVDYVDISALNDLTDGGNNNVGDAYRIQWPQQMENGYDGYLAGMTSSDYEAYLDASTTPAKKLKGRGYGLVKAAAPGTAYITTGLAVSQKLRTMVASLNWCNKVEMPYQFCDWDVYNEEDLIDWVNNQFVRGDNGDYASTHFPSFAYIRDPFADSESDARLILVPAMGFILGNEAFVAKKYEGYHKAPTGVTVQIPEIVELPAIGRPENPVQLDEEKLNPAGINVLKWRNSGSTVIQWGDRTLSRNNVLKWLHKRYLLSQYGNDLQEGFDFTIFQINDPIEDTEVLADLHDYFLDEYRKRAIRGKSFVNGSNPAAIFKMDSDNNTDATRGQGDQIVEVSLRIADTIERLRIFLGAMGVVEAGI